MIIKERYNAITTCEKMCHAGREATSFYHKEYQKRPQAIKQTLFGINDILNCNSDLPKTYTVRIYSEFEVTLRDYWTNGMGKRTKPYAQILIDRIAARNYIRTDELENAHNVREYRNSLVHGGSAQTVTLGEARSYLCKYLSNLPRKW